MNFDHWKRKPYFPFGLAAIGWIALSVGLCWKLSSDTGAAKRALHDFAILSSLCLLDLFALAKVFSGLFLLMQPRPESQGRVPLAAPVSSENPIFLVIRTSYWGAIKIVCLIFLGTLLARGSSQARIPSIHRIQSIPEVGLLTGVSTLWMVPLLGGLIWHFQKKGLS